MAVRTVSDTGGNWNATTTWVGGVVPSATLDTVAFTATSGQLTVNVASICIGIDFTNYVNTITFTALLTINGPINLGTGGYTQAGGSGIQANATATLTSNGVTWSRLWAFAGISQTFTLADNFNFTGSLNFNGITSIIINGNTINTRNILSTTTAITSGTTAFVFNGTGTWSNTSTGVLQNNVTINTAGTLTIGNNIYYNTGILTHTTGTVDTTTNNSTLNIGVSTTLNTSGITWNNVFIGIKNASSTIVITLNDNFTIGGSLQVNGTLSFIPNTYLLIVNGDLILGYYAGGVYYNVTLTIPNDLIVTNLNYAVFGINTIVNGFSITVLGNLSIANTGVASVSGTTNLILGGTGIWSQTSTGSMRNNLTINTTGTITISGNVYYNTGTLTYTAGTVVTTGSTLNISLTTTLNTNYLFWNNVIITSGIQTLTSDLNCQNLTSGNNTINGLFNINVNGNLTANGVILIGTATIVLVGTGTWTAPNGSNTFRAPIIINTNGVITLANILNNSGNLTYIKGTVKSNNTTITFGPSIILLNLNKLIFKNIILEGSLSVTMNEFFSGNPSLITNISSTNSQNYTITFQDGFEKIAKFVNIRNCTLSKPQQLLVITNSKKSSTNTRGIRYINQSPNGIPEGKPSIQNQTTFGAGGLLADPNMK